MTNPHVLIHNHRDNVGVMVVEESSEDRIKALCVVTEDDSEFIMESVSPVPLGHKIALKSLKAGDTVIKYGVDIGRLIEDVHPGSHVHVHNLKTKRW
ncbi:MAG: UxaA family hydrolase [Pseudomonadota bacterium]